MVTTVQEAIYRLTLDVAEYNKAAASKTASDQEMLAAAAKLTESSEKITAATRSQGAELDRVVGRVDRVQQAENRRIALLAELSRKLQSGRIESDAYAASVARINTAVDAQVASLQRSGMAFKGFGGAMQQVGYQVGDLAVQIASGQGVIRPLIQQGTQVVQAFGPVGAVLGAAGAVAGALAVAFLDLGDSTESATKKQEDYNKAIEDYLDLMADEEELAKRRAQRRIEEVQGRIAQEIGDRAPKIDDLETRRRRQQEAEIAAAAAAAPGIPSQVRPLEFALETERDKDVADQRRVDLLQLKKETDEYFADVEKGLKQQAELTKALSDMERDSAERRTKDAKEAADLAKKAAEERLKSAKAQQDELTKALSDLERDTADANAKAAKEAATESKKANDERLKAAKAEADELNRWLDLQQQALKAQGEQVKAETERERAQIAANDNLQDYIRKLEDAATLDGRTATDKKVQAALIEAQNKLLDKQGKKLGELSGLDKQRIETAVRQADAYDAQRKAAEQAARELEKGTDRAVENTADLFYDAMEGKIDSIGDLLERTLKRSLAEGLAELARPIIKPIVGFVQQAGSALFGGGAAGSAAPAGGGVGIGNFGFLSNLIPSSWTSGIGSGITSGINSFGASLGFSPGVASVMPTGAPLIGANGMLTGGGATSIVPGQVASGSAFGPTTLSGVLGGAGIGFGAGQLLRAAGVGKGGSMIGGAASGALAGWMMGGPWGAVAGGIAGLVGGGIGGEQGPPAAAANFGIDAQGRISGGRRATDNEGNSDRAMAVVQAASNVLSALAQAGGARFLGDPSLQAYTLGDSLSIKAAAGGQVFTGERMSVANDEAGALALARAIINSGFVSGGGSALTAGRNSAAGSAQGLIDDINFGGLYDSLVKLQRPANDVRDTFEQLSKTFDETATRGDQLGLPSQQLRNGMAANFNQEIDRALQGIFDPLGLALADFEEGAKARLDYARKLGADLVDLERLNAIERNQILVQFGQAANDNLAGLLTAAQRDSGAGRVAGVIGSINDFLSGLSTGQDSVLSPAARADAARAEFERQAGLARGGNFDALSGIAGSAQTFLAAQRDLTGSGSATVAAVQQISSVLTSLASTDSTMLIQQAALAEQRNGNATMQAMLTELTAIKSVLQQNGLMPSRIAA